MNRALWTFLVAIAAICCATPACAQDLGRRDCALGYRNSIFTPSEWPSRSLEELARGEFGVIDPRFDHFYLFIAWRRIAGKSLTAQDIERLRTFDPCWNDGSKAYFGQDWNSSAVMAQARGEWDAARRLPGMPPVTARKPGTSSVMGYSDSQVPNCNPDAFRNAARTLRARADAHAGSPWLVDWVRAQDIVMQACYDAAAGAPAPAPADAPAWLRADRAYQKAAAEFYAGQYDLAASSFGAIAQDNESPWQPWGLYLAARSKIRQASAASKDTDIATHLQNARSLLDEASSRTRDGQLRNDILRMRQRVRLRLEPDGVFAELDARLAAAVLSPGAGQDLRDFDPARAANSKFDPRDPGFAAWLQALRSGAAPRAGDAATASPLALVAWLATAKRDDAGVAELLRAASLVPRTSPAYRTVQLHRIRLMSDRRQARQLALQLLSQMDRSADIQDRNLFKAAALDCAQDARELAAWAYREPIDHPEVRRLVKDLAVPAVDSDGAAILNRAMPLDSLYALYRSSSTPKRLRDELLGVVWTRALVLERWDVLGLLQPDMLAAFPGAAALLRRVAAASGPPERGQLAALFLVRHPGIVGSLSTEITYADPRDRTQLALPNMHRALLQDGSRDNWWCSLPAVRYWHEDPAPKAPELPAFLSEAQRRRWRAEYARLVAQPNATEYLAPAVLRWARTHPADPELPLALRMIVRSARGGCVTSAAQGLGHKAFRHLHRHFPHSEAAKQTRTWG